MLVEPGRPLQYSWFIEQGVASVVLATVEGLQSEVGIVGREGMVDTATLHGVDSSFHRCFIQVEGSGYRLPASVVQSAMEESRTIRQVMMSYAHSFVAQVSTTALVNASCSIEQRLARWLLMYHDRIDGDDLSITHEFLSLMLNVRRAGVTLAVQTLERAELVVARRGAITIADRAGLERFAASAYTATENI